MSSAPDQLRNFGFLIKDIGRLYTKLFEAEADHLGITLAQAKVLTYLSKNAGINQIQLAELSGIEPMSLVRLLDRMEADDWIERRPHPTDRRARQLHLKSQAQATLDQIFKLSSQVRSRALTGFKAEERSTLIDLLERVHGQLVQSLAEQGDKTPSADAGESRVRVKRSVRRVSRAASSRNGKVQRASR